MARWAEEDDLPCILRPDVPTRRSTAKTGGHTIDLAFSNLPGARAQVDRSQSTTSDHYTIVIRFGGRSKPSETTRFAKLKGPHLERFQKLLQMSIEAVTTTPPTIQAGIDTLATGLQAATSAIRGAGRPSTSGTRSAPWWTDNCRKADTAYQRAQQDARHPAEQEARDYRRVVREAKRCFWESNWRQQLAQGHL